MNRSIPAVILMLSLSGCGGDYPAEKLFWKAGRIKQEIAANPAQSPPAQFERAEVLFQDVIRLYPRSPQSVLARLAIGELHALAGRDDQAAAVFAEIIKTQPQNRELGLRAQIAWLRLREKKEPWPAVKADCWALAEAHADTLDTLALPLYVARHARKSESAASAQEDYDRAAAYYVRAASASAGTALGLAALDFAFQVYAETADWPRALDALQTIRERFPRAPEAAKAAALRARILRMQKEKTGPAAGPQPEER